MMWWSPDNDIPINPLWWAVEHKGHPAFYLRSLMAGDMAPISLGPLPRHTYEIQRGQQIEEFPIHCCTCGKIPNPLDLEPIQRVNGQRGRALFFKDYVEGRRIWPQPTSITTCWLCSDPTVPAVIPVGSRRVCQGCAAHLTRALVRRDLDKLEKP